MGKIHLVLRHNGVEKETLVTDLDEAKEVLARKMVNGYHWCIDYSVFGADEWDCAEAVAVERALGLTPIREIV